jgi:hypothetical protein
MNQSTLLSLTFVAVQSVASAAVLLNQPLVAFDARTSSVTTAGTSGLQTWDRVALPFGGYVNRISWTGGFIDFANPANNPINPTADSWGIKVAFDSEGEPGAVSASQSFLFNAVTQTLLGNSTIAGQPVRIYSFTANLSTPIFFNANENMWLTVYSVAPTTNPLFAWVSGSGGDGVAKQVNVSTGNVGSYTDRALVLEGTEAPEPATFWSIGLAGVALAAFRRRK